jgi:hypothetical protein
MGNQWSFIDASKGLFLLIVAWKLGDRALQFRIFNFYWDTVR